MGNIVHFENVGLRYGTGPETLSDVSFTKLCDVASPILSQHCAMGKTIPKA